MFAGLEAAIAGTGDRDDSVGAVGEFGLITAFAAKMPIGPVTTLGIGDDSAVVATPSGSVVAAVDMVLEGRHFLRTWSSGYDVGVKSAARSLADIAAMGAVPTALLAAVALPESLPASWALDLAAGLAFEAERAGAGIVGGDTASGESVLVSITALGDLDGLAPVRRSGATAGEVVAVSGTLGHSAAGLALLASGAADQSEEPDSAITSLVTAHLRPSPAYAAGPAAARAGATAMIDVSDGLIADLGHVAAASGVRIDLSARALDPFLAAVAPAADAVASVSAAVSASASGSASALDWVLTGGEDHSLVATFPASAALPAGWRVIGSVRGLAEEEASNVTIDGRAYAKSGGWEHFR